MKIIVDNRDKPFEINENGKVYRYDSEYNEIEVTDLKELNDDNKSEKKELEMIFSLSTLNSLPPI